MTTIQSNNGHLPNLNGVRFFAALFVILHHIEQYKDIFGLPSYWGLSFFRQLGPLGVVLFFVLSGFLITHLLLQERDKTNDIHIPKFYLRRVFRIWPLYYLIVILGLFVLPHIPILNVPGLTENVQQSFGSKLSFFAVILPNVAIALGDVPYLAQTWSIGIEEQFYIGWPWFVKYAKNKFLLSAILLLILFYAIRFVGVTVVPDSWVYVKAFLTSLRMTCLIIGGLTAYCARFYMQHKAFEVIFNVYFQVVLWLILVLMIATSFYVYGLNQEIYSVFFALIIVNLALNPKTIVNIENRIFDYLGQISYGLYMYHVIAVVLSVRLAMAFFNNSAIAITIFSLIGTVGTASLSYYLFEKPFLKMKDRYGAVKLPSNISK
jgi:peptidoglycan/LPS O-acetylase OafA/YrhL